MSICIGNKTINKDSDAFIIAEIGVNHNGNVDLAKQMIKVAKDCGVDAVKFQTFITEELVSKNAKKAEYQMENTEESSQFEMLKKLELSEDDFKILRDYALSLDLIFLSSPFDIKSVDLLENLDIPAYKLGSGELNNFELINYIQSKNKPLILSTGMATFDEIMETYNFIENKNNLIILHCISSYPSSFEDANLNFIKTLQSNLDVPIGFSDHSPGIELPIAAVALGAKVIEKHFTLDKSLKGPDHKASLNPKELKLMVDSIRNVEIAMGNGIRKLSKNELEIKNVARKSIIIKNFISKGSKIRKEDLIIKRPGNGIPPKYLDKIIGKKAKNDLNEDNLLTWNDFE